MMVMKSSSFQQWAAGKEAGEINQKSNGDYERALEFCSEWFSKEGFDGKLEMSCCFVTIYPLRCVPNPFLSEFQAEAYQSSHPNP